MKKLLKVLRNLRASHAGRTAPVRVLLRFVWLQFWRSVRKRTFRFTVCTGSVASVDPTGDFSAITPLYYFDLPDYEVNAFVLHLLRPGDEFLDIGANLGPWELLLAPRGVICRALEPAPATFALLKQQLAIQSAEVRSRLSALNVAAGGAAAAMRFTVDRGTANCLLAPGATYPGASVEVPVVPLDTYVGIWRPTVIKIDVEGWFLPVLEGARMLLAQPGLKAVVMETFRFADWNSPALRAAEILLGAYGFTPCDYDPVSRRVQRLASPNEGGQDTIYVRLESNLERQLQHGAPVSYLGLMV